MTSAGSSRTLRRCSSSGAGPPCTAAGPSIRSCAWCLPAERWATDESAYYPPLFGTLFEMASGQRVVELLIRRAERSATDHLYVQFEDTQGHYFSSAFEESVHSSTDYNKVIPVGFPADYRFRVARTRYRRHVLKDGSKAPGWLPLVLILTWGSAMDARSRCSSCALS